MKRFLTSIFLFLAIFLSSCRTDKDVQELEATLTKSLLQGTWLHAHEEDQNNVQVYRPSTYSFGPSRGRTGFSFGRNGLFTQYDIAPTDGILVRQGRWTYEGNNVFFISLDDTSRPSYRIEIVSVDNQVLRVRYL